MLLLLFHLSAHLPLFVTALLWFYAAFVGFGAALFWRSRCGINPPPNLMAWLKESPTFYLDGTGRWRRSPPTWSNRRRQLTGQSVRPEPTPVPGPGISRRQ